MDIVQILSSVVEIAPTLYMMFSGGGQEEPNLPPLPPAPAAPDFSAVLASLSSTSSIRPTSIREPIRENTGDIRENTGIDMLDAPDDVEAGIGCLPCSRDHLTTVSAALDEAMRFARSEGVDHPEVHRRLRMSAQELNILERIDASPAAVESLPPLHQALMERTLPKIRALRHQMPEIRTVDELQRAATEASELSEEFWNTSVMLERSGGRVEEMLEVARRVKAEEITEEEGREELRGILEVEECDTCQIE